MVPKGAENEAVAQVIQSMAAEAGFDMKIRVTEFATSLQAGRGRRIPGLSCSTGAAASIPTAIPTSSCTPTRRRTTAPSPIRKPTRRSTTRRLVTDQAQRKAIYEKLTKIVLDDEPILYLYHRKLLIAHTTKLEGYKQMPDGLVRVVGLKLK